MKRIITNIFSIGLGIALLPACVKDKGNYTYNLGNAVTMRYATYQYSAFLNDTIKVYPIRTFSNPADTTEFEHAWYINGVQISNEPVLKYVGKELGDFPAYYYMTDKKSGIKFPAVSQVTLKVTSPYAEGWGILYEKNNESELAHVRITGGVYHNYLELYRKMNEGAVMGSGPLRIRDYTINYNTRGMFVSQTGGDGPIEVDANSMKRKLVVKNIFTAGAPADLAPVDMTFLPTTDFMINGNGKVYARVKPENPLPFATPWVSTPLFISGGLEVDDVWECWTGFSGWGIMHDKLNNRLISARQYVMNMGNPAVGLEVFPTPEIPYPAAYTSLSNMGNWQYVWGGTFKDNYNTMDGTMIIRSPDDNDLYFQTFHFGTDGIVPKITPKTRTLFKGNSVATAASKYTAVKDREYLFFSGGAGNNEIWYFDVKTNAPVVKYVTLPAAVTSIVAHDDGNSIAVGLADGTFLVYDISNQVIIDGVSKELHRITGLGKVVDIIVKGGRTN